MSASLEIRPLSATDDRGDFSCGQADLDRFFQHYAGQNQFKLHVAVTYVALLSARIVGFVTLAVGGLEREHLPSDKLRRRMPAYPLPVLRLAWLGVDKRAQGLGVGQALLQHALGLAVAQRDALGCIGVVTDAKPESVAFYERYGFVSLAGVIEGSLHGEPTPMFLALDTISAAGR